MNKPTPFNVSSESQGARCVVRPTGEVDVATSSQLRDAITAAVADDPVRQIVADLTEVEFIDSTGLAVLIRAHEAMGEGGRELVVVCANPDILRVLDLAGLGGLVTLVGSLDEAPAA